MSVSIVLALFAVIGVYLVWSRVCNSFWGEVYASSVTRDTVTSGLMQVHDDIKPQPIKQVLTADDELTQHITEAKKRSEVILQRSRRKAK